MNLFHAAVLGALQGLPRCSDQQFRPPVWSPGCLNGPNPA
jgi:hypothetical protein